VLAAGFAAAVLNAAPGVSALGPVRNRFFPRLAGAGSPRHLALTFDDGPDPAATPEVLRVLADRGVQATFFMLGSMADRSPGLAAEVAAAGHEIAVHGFEHRWLPLRGPRATFGDLSRAVETVGSVAGARPRLFRPPYGVLSGAALAACRSLRLAPVLWTSWGREWVPGATPESVYATAAGGLRGGGTLLLHDSDCTAPAGSARAALGALPRLLDHCAEHGLTVGPLRDHGRC
jgi:peptidoglycan/xylan/chitin deacetylase (PgdA/CDA1 family)